MFLLISPRGPFEQLSSDKYNDVLTQPILISKQPYFFLACFVFNFYVMLVQVSLTMLCWFRAYSKVNRLYIYIYIFFFFRFFPYRVTQNAE